MATLVLQAHQIFVRGFCRLMAEELASPSQKRKADTHCVLCGGRLR